MDLSWSNFMDLFKTNPFGAMVLILGFSVLALLRKEIVSMMTAGKDESAISKMLQSIDQNGAEAAEMFEKNLEIFAAVKDDTRRMVESLADIQRNTASSLSIQREEQLSAARFGGRK